VPVKPNAKSLQIKEQIIDDRPSGLSLMFEALPDGTSKLVICGDSLPFGNREIIFGMTGEEGGGGTALMSACRPTWLREVS
jgi:hypothetical protein